MFLPAKHVASSLVVAVAVAAASLVALSGASETEAQNGQYLYFDGHGALEIPDRTDLNPSAITVEAWIFLEDHDAHGGGNEPVIAGKDYADGFLFTVWNGQLRFYPGAGASSVIGDTVLPLNEWVHVAATFQGDFVLLYINGVEDKGEALSQNLGVSSSALRIGSDVQVEQSPQGAIDELRIWQYSRSGQEIADNMNREITESEDGHPIGVWNMNSTNSDVGGFTGTLIGDAEFRSGPIGGGGNVWGDHNCSDLADAIDGLLTLRHDAGMRPDTGDCPEFGDTVTVNGNSVAWGDVDCSGVIDAIDSLKILRHDAGLAVNQPGGCPQIGTEVALS
jgi:hypothetical protein